MKTPDPPRDPKLGEGYYRGLVSGFPRPVGPYPWDLPQRRQHVTEMPSTTHGGVQESRISIRDPPSSNYPFGAQGMLFRSGMAPNRMPTSLPLLSIPGTPTTPALALPTTASSAHPSPYTGPLPSPAQPSSRSIEHFGSHQNVYRESSRPRNKSRDRSSSKPKAKGKVANVGHEGKQSTASTTDEFTRKRPRSLARSHCRRDGSNTYNVIDDTESDDEHHHYLTKSGKRFRQKGSRYFTHGEGDSTGDESLDVGSKRFIPPSTQKSNYNLRSTARASTSSDPVRRLSGPMSDMMIQMDEALIDCISQSEKMTARVRRLDDIIMKIKAEMKELPEPEPELSHAGRSKQASEGLRRPLYPPRPVAAVPVPPSLHPVPHEYLYGSNIGRQGSSRMKGKARSIC
ncbi:MAG: hypothetical protein J3Q66DRAFT_403870 [Benniella sp.]|nr:MAG: hypothetical protein J3Q66DRAFT_403870 [Benniella sp.]